jgi:hypothetical protein
MNLFGIDFEVFEARPGNWRPYCSIDRVIYLPRYMLAYPGLALHLVLAHEEGHKRQPFLLSLPSYVLQFFGVSLFVVGFGLLCPGIVLAGVLFLVGYLPLCRRLELGAENYAAITLGLEYARASRMLDEQPAVPCTWGQRVWHGLEHPQTIYLCL